MLTPLKSNARPGSSPMLADGNEDETDWPSDGWEPMDCGISPYLAFVVYNSEVFEGQSS